MLAPELELHALAFHRVDDEPARHSLELLSASLLLRESRELRRTHVARGACAQGRLGRHEPLHLRDDEEKDRLPLADAAHAVRALGVITPHHILPERQDGACTRALGNVHARRVHLVKERKAALLGKAAPLHVHRRGGARGAAQQDLLMPARLEVHDAIVLVCGQSFEQEVGHVQVRHAGHERARVDEGVRGRLVRNHGLKQLRHVPCGRHELLRDDERVGERLEHLGVVSH